MKKQKEKINLEELKEKHESDLTKQERRLLEKEKLKDMSILGKLEYVWMYYKPVLFGILGFIILIFVGIDIYQNLQTETVLSVAVVDVASGSTQGLAEDVQECLAITEKNQEVQINSNFVSDGKSEGLDYYSQMAFVTQVQAKTIDVVLLPEDLCGIYEEEGYFADLKELLGEEKYALFGDSADTYHLELSQEEISESLELPYEPVCVAVLVNTPHAEAASEWLSAMAD